VNYELKSANAGDHSVLSFFERFCCEKDMRALSEQKNKKVGQQVNR
jgi:hypothetical protein